MYNKEYFTKWRLKNKDKIKNYNKKYRQNHKEKMVVIQKKYATKHPQKRVELNKKHILKNPLKYKVRNLTRYAIDSGKIKRQPCEVCGNIKVEAHHEDYSKPFVIKWLCKYHHESIKIKADSK